MYERKNCKIMSVEFLKILVFIKVIKKDEEINESDVTALDFSYKLKEKYGATIHAISIIDSEDYMSYLKEAYVRGADSVEAYVQKEAETPMASAMRIKKIIVEKHPDWDYIIFGEVSSDTSFGVVPQLVGGLLGVSVVHGVLGVEFQEERVIVETDFFGTKKCVLDKKTIVSLFRDALKTRIPGLKEKIEAKKKKIMIVEDFFSEDTNEVDARLKKISKPKPKERMQRMYTLDELEQVSEEILKIARG